MPLAPRRLRLFTLTTKAPAFSTASAIPSDNTPKASELSFRFSTILSRFCLYLEILYPWFRERTPPVRLVLLRQSGGVPPSQWADDPCRIAYREGVWRDVFRDDRTRTNDSVLADYHA